MKRSEVRKIAFALALTLVVFVVAACGADIDSTLVIDDSFKGERRFKVVLSAETLQQVEGGINTVKQAIKDSMPDVLTVAYETGDEGAEIVNFTMTFDSRDDYADKLSELLAVGRTETTLSINYDTSTDDPFSNGFAYEENVTNAMLFDWLIKALEATGKVDAKGEEMINSESFVILQNDIEYTLARSGDGYDYRSTVSLLDISEAKWIIRYLADDNVEATLYLGVDYKKGNAAKFDQWAAAIEEETGATFKVIADDVQNPFYDADYRMTQGIFTLSGTTDDITEFGKKMSRDPNYSLSIEPAAESESLFGNTLEIRQTMDSSFLNYPQTFFVLPAGTQKNDKTSEDYYDIIAFSDYNFSFVIEPDTSFKDLLGYDANEMVVSSFDNDLHIAVNRYMPIYNVVMDSTYGSTGDMDREIKIEMDKENIDSILTKVKDLAIDAEVEQLSDKEAFTKTGEGIRIKMQSDNMTDITAITNYFVPLESTTHFVDRSFLKYVWIIEDIIDGDFLNRTTTVSYHVELPSMGKFDIVGQKQWKEIDDDRHVKYRITGDAYVDDAIFKFEASGTKLWPLVLLIAGGILLLIVIIVIIVVVLKKNKKKKRNNPQEVYAQYPQYPQPDQFGDGQQSYDPNQPYMQGQYNPNPAYGEQYDPNQEYYQMPYEPNRPDADPQYDPNPAYGEQYDPNQEYDQMQQNPMPSNDGGTQSEADGTKIEKATQPETPSTGEPSAENPYGADERKADTTDTEASDK